MSAPSEGKRRRAQIACENCRRRKIRCDTGQPTCANCSRAQAKCVYIPTQRMLSVSPSSNSGSQQKRQKRSIDERLGRIEHMLAQLTSSGPLTPDGDDTLSSGDQDTSRLEDTDCKLLPNHLTTAFQNDSAVESPKKVQFGHPDESICAPEDMDVYNHGVMSSVLAPEIMRKLGEQIGDSSLEDNLKRSFKAIWRHRALWARRAAEQARSPSQVDEGYLNYCLNRYLIDRPSEESLISVVLPYDEVAQLRQRTTWADALSRNSPYTMVFASVIIVESLRLKRSNDYALYKKDFVEIQAEIAFYHGIKAVGIMLMAPPSYHMFRILLAFAISSSTPSLLSYVGNLLSLAFRVARAIGLNREEFYLTLPPEQARERQIAWWICYNCDQISSILLGQAPNFPDDEISIPVPVVGEGNTNFDAEIQLLLIGTELHRIYSHLYENLYSVSARRRHRSGNMRMWTREERLKFSHQLATIDKELESWKRKFEMMVLHMPQDRWPENMLIYQLRAEYGVVMLQIFCPLAFSVGMPLESLDLPGRLSRAVDVVADTALHTLEWVYQLSKFSGIAAVAPSICAGTAYCALFLKQIFYPQHPSNSSDRIVLRGYITRFRDGPQLGHLVQLHRVIIDVLMTLTNALDALAAKRNANKMPGKHADVPKPSASPAETAVAVALVSASANETEPVPDEADDQSQEPSIEPEKLGHQLDLLDDVYFGNDPRLMADIFSDWTDDINPGANTLDGVFGVQDMPVEKCSIM